MSLRSSGVKTADATILSKPGVFHQLLVQPDGTNDVTIAIHDGTDNTGTQVLPSFVFPGDGGPQATPPIRLKMSVGIYADITLAAGTAAYTVLWTK